jgi:hypothetical protein
MEIDDIDAKRELAAEKVYLLLREKQRSRKSRSRGQRVQEEKPDLDNTSWLSLETSRTRRSNSRPQLLPIDTSRTIESTGSRSALSRANSQLGSTSPLDRTTSRGLPLSPVGTATSATSSPYRTTTGQMSPKRKLFTQESFSPKWEHYDVMKSRWKQIEVELRRLK